jgi:hypothetical protein
MRLHLPGDTDAGYADERKIWNFSSFSIGIDRSQLEASRNNDGAEIRQNERELPKEWHFGEKALILVMLLVAVMQPRVA